MITCISDIYYKIGRWFTIVMAAICFITLPFALERLESIWSFLACIGILFVGIAAEYRDKTTYPIHYASACVSAVSSLVFVVMVQPLCLAAMAIGLIGLMDKQRWLLYCEIGCFVSFYLALMS